MSNEEASVASGSRNPVPPIVETLSALMMPRTTVDGQGMWRSWTRVFESASSACLDLLDNCLDAALHSSNGKEGNNSSFRGRVELGRLEFVEAENGNLNPNGVTITNNSIHPIKSLEDSLTVYKTSKNNGNNTTGKAIGENGVGLKHGCATLSNTSFVLTRNSNNHFQLGVIAKDLQTPQGIYLPSFDFETHIDNSRNLCITPELVVGQKKQALSNRIQEITEKHPRVAQIIAKDLGGGNLESGTENLVYQFLRIWQDEWEKQDHVFSLVICDLLNTAVGGEPDEDEGSTGAEHDDEAERKVPSSSAAEGFETGEGSCRRTRNDAFADPAKQFLDEIMAMLPRYYINIPMQGFDFRIENAPVRFSYWENRLVELTKFTVYVPKATPIQDIDDEKWDKMGYSLNCYCGFDPTRVMKEGDGACSLYIYSRNRLIKQDSDARHIIGLNTQGSTFMQGLTVLVDDTEAQLPLMPTKDGIAWSEQKGGQIHRSNLHAWAGTVASFFWNFHFKKVKTESEKRKLRKPLEVLKSLVKSFADPVLSLLDEEKEDSATEYEQSERMGDANFTHYVGLKWAKRVARGTNKLCIYSSRRGNPPKAIVGDATDFKFTDERIELVFTELQGEEKGKAKKRSARKRGSRKQTEAASQEDSDEENEDDRKMAAATKARASRKKINYADADTTDEESFDEEERSVAVKQDEDVEDTPANRKRAAAPSEDEVAPDGPLSSGNIQDAAAGASPKKRRKVASPIPNHLIIEIPDSSDEEIEVDVTADAGTTRLGDYEVQKANKDLKRELQDTQMEISQLKIQLEQQKMETIAQQREVGKLRAELRERKRTHVPRQQDQDQDQDHQTLQNAKDYWEKEAEEWKERCQRSEQTVRRLQSNAKRASPDSVQSAVTP